jgi:hypothetical protein
MSSPLWKSLLRRVCILSGAAILVTVSATAQSLQSANPVSQSSSQESSSSAIQYVVDSDPSGAMALHDAAAGLGSGKGAGEGQYDRSGGRGLFSRLAFEAGAGANPPVGTTSSYLTWGGNFTVGGGLHFSRGISLLAEYQLLDNKLPGNLIAETGANGGNAHIWSLTLDPVIDLFPKSTNSIYVTGGGGFYRKVTNFTDPQEALYCDYYDCGIVTQNVVVGHFSSNQGGWNVGAGFTHRLGGLSGDGQMKLFAEARFLDVDTPAVSSSPNGLGTTTVAAGTKVVPITLGVRW